MPIDNTKNNNESKVELNAEQTEKVSGGYIFHNPIKHFPFEVRSDSSGYVIGRYSTLKEAEQAAKKDKISTTQLTLDELKTLQDESYQPNFPFETDQYN